MSNGTVRNLDGAPDYGSLANTKLAAPITGIASTPDRHGFWLVGRDGGVFTFGDAHFYGSLAQNSLAQPIVGIAGSSGGDGYWLAGAEGRVFGFGDARSYASTVSQPIVAITATHAGYGYWLVGASGKVFSFGPAHSLGSLAETAATGSVIGMVVDKTGAGYWLMTAKGRVFNYGDASLDGSAGTVNEDVAAVGEGPDGGFSVVGANGTLINYFSRAVVPAGDTFTSSWARRDVQSLPVSSSSSEIVSNFVQQYKQNYGAVGVNQQPTLTVGADQPMVEVTVRTGCGDFLGDTGTEIPIPPAAASLVSQSGDSALVVWQPSTATEWELWQAYPQSDGTWQACWGGKLTGPSHSSGVFTYPYGLSASGISYLATTVTEGDVAAGYIDHTLAVDIVDCNAPQVAPANRTDCGSEPGEPTEGTMFRLPADVEMPPNLTPFAQMVFRALKSYGMVVTDKAGAVMLQAESSGDWAAEGNAGTDPITSSWQGKPEYEVLQGIPWSELQVVTP